MNELVNRDAEHLRLLAIFHFVAAGLGLAGLLFLAGHYAIMQSFLNDPDMFKDSKATPPPKEFFAIFRIFYLVAGTWFLLNGVGNLLSAIYLRQRRNRVFSMVVAGFNCLWMPLGTILGVFTFVVLGRTSVTELYQGKV
jgi:hypothetical protein